MFQGEVWALDAHRIYLRRNFEVKKKGIEQKKAEYKITGRIE